MFLNQYNNMQNTAKFYWNYSVPSEESDVQRRLLAILPSPLHTPLFLV